MTVDYRTHEGYDFLCVDSLPIPMQWRSEGQGQPPRAPVVRGTKLAPQSTKNKLWAHQNSLLQHCWPRAPNFFATPLSIFVDVVVFLIVYRYTSF